MAKITETPKVMLLAQLLDGRDGSERVTCGLCRSPKVRFFSSAGLRRRQPTVPRSNTTCIGRCLAAAKALPFMTALRATAKEDRG